MANARNGDDGRHETEQTFRLLVEGVRDCAIFMLDPQGNVQTWNSGAAIIKGYRADEIIGHHMSIFYPPEARASGLPQALLAQATVDGRVASEGWRVRKDGSRFWADVIITALHDDRGALTGFAKVSRDLSERKRADEEIRRRDERFRLIVENIKDYAILMLDAEGRVATWNRGAERLTGFAAAEIIGRPFSTFYGVEDIASGKPARELQMVVEQGQMEDESWRVRKDGSRFWANVVMTALRNPGGELVGIAKITRDLSERRKLEEERLQRVQAQEAVRLRDEFLSIVSHELKTPLTALQLQLQSLQERVDSLDEKLAAKVTRATRSGDRLADLIESLLDVSRIATGRMELALERFDLADLVEEVVEGLRPAARRAQCELSVKREGSPVGSWDRVRIEQVVTNLLSNAFKYGAGAPVEISVRRRGDQVLLGVRDHGPGIAEKDRGRIFGRFERAVSLHNYGGLGVGLYVTRQIADAHGGKVSVENMPDGGARFSLELPVEQSHARAEGVSAPEIH